VLLKYLIRVYHPVNTVPFNGFIFLIAVLFAGVFLAYVLTDTTSYQNDIKGWTDDNISRPATE